MQPALFVRGPSAALHHPRGGPYPVAQWMPGCQEELGERSCTKDEVLWLRTLERYGSTCKHWAAARSGVDIPEAPTFYPTVEEFQDPGGCVASVRTVGLPPTPARATLPQKA